MSNWGPDEEQAGADALQNLAEIDLKSRGGSVLEFWKAVRPKKIPVSRTRQVQTDC